MCKRQEEIRPEMNTMKIMNLGSAELKKVLKLSRGIPTFLS